MNIFETVLILTLGSLNNFLQISLHVVVYSVAL